MNPHVLVMSATPIPRTLSLILYGDVDISVIKQLPSGRKPIVTEYVPAKQFEKIHTAIQEAVQRREQVFLVCPLVVESETLELNSAETMWESLSILYPDLSVGLVHGKLKSKEKDQMMRDFEAHKIDVLVATTVIEVGINVPRATVMIIMDADRFGLSQLHQLRGRVGRGGNQSYCYLISNQPGKIAKERISTMVASTDGFYIADQDLALRGPGEFFGTRQHGLPQLKLADLSKHLEILATAQEAVRELFNRIEREEEDMAYLQRLKQSIVEKFAL
jgi:ATP-dependent DNA helicase RecG